MSDGREPLEVLGTTVMFRREHLGRAREVKQLVEERFAANGKRLDGGRSQEAQIVFLALGLADELLQERSRRAEMEKTMAAWLEKIKRIHSHSFSLGRS